MQPLHSASSKPVITDIAYKRNSETNKLESIEITSNLPNARVSCRLKTYEPMRTASGIAYLPKIRKLFVETDENAKHILSMADIAAIDTQKDSQKISLQSPHFKQTLHLVRHYARLLKLQPKEVITLIKGIIENDKRFQKESYDLSEETTEHFESPQRSLNSCLALIEAKIDKVKPYDRQIQNGLYQRFTASLAKTNQPIEKILKLLSNDLSSLIDRPIDCYIPNSENPSSRYEQHFGTLTAFESAANSDQDDKKVIHVMNPHITPSSVAIKSPSSCYDHKKQNWGLGSIINGNQLTIGRSGRSDSIEKLEELLIYNATQALSANKGNVAGATGFNTQGEFQMVITSALDLNHLKMMVTFVKEKVLSLKGENERKSIHKMNKSINTLFPKGQDVIHKNVMVEVDGKKVIQNIAIKKPLLMNMVMSGQSGSAANIISARKLSHKTHNIFLQQMITAFSTPKNPESFTTEETIARVRTLNVLQQHLPAKEKMNLLANNPEIWSSLQTEQYLALEALSLMVSGKTLEGANRLTGKNDSAHEFILHRALINLCGFAHTVQCKSGQDRTLTMLSLAIAYDANKLVHKKEFFNSSAHFVEHFTAAAHKFGKNVAMAARGKFSIKWSSHFIPRNFYRPENNTSEIGKLKWLDALSIKKDSSSSDTDSNVG